MIDVPDLAAQWGKLFGGINEINTFRGTTVYTRADSIAALYVSAAEQRLASDGLYNQAVEIDTGLDFAVTFYMNMAKDTLKLRCVEDSNYPIATDDETLYKKFIADALGTSQTFQRPTVTVNSGTGAQLFTAVTTPLGTPYGDGTIVGTPVDPATGLMRPFIYPETIKAVCTVDSYNGGATAGQETFTVQGYASIDTVNAEWPKGSGVNTELTSAPTTTGTLISNSYFENWDTSDVNQPSDWTLSGLVTGTNVTQSTDAYIGSYSMRVTAAPLNSYFRQAVNQLEGPLNYVVAVRIKRVTTITGGVLQYALRDAAGNVINNALGSPLSGTIALTGAASSTWVRTVALFSVPRGFPSTVYFTWTFTTAMNAAETIGVDQIEFIPMTSLYTGGVDIAFLPGGTAWAAEDTYEAVVANNATTAGFIRAIDRLYGDIAKVNPPPTANSPTISDALIS